MPLVERAKRSLDSSQLKPAKPNFYQGSRSDYNNRPCNRSPKILNNATLRIICLGLIFLALSACTQITTVMPDGKETTRTREEFEAYVESVFRRQNRASLAAGELLESPIDPNLARQLEFAEQRVLEACSALNQVAREKMQKQDSDLSLEIQVKDSIGDCDFATRVLEELIAESE